MSDPAAPVRRRFARLRAATDRVPTKWFAGILTAIFLAGTAGFGGLSDAATPPVASLEVGDTFAGPQLDITVDSVVLIDDIPELYLDLRPGQRVLVILAHMTNNWDRQQVVSAFSGDIADLVQIQGSDALLLTAVRVDDSTESPWLQPGISAPIGLVYGVSEKQYDEGDEVVLELFSQTLTEGQVVLSGEWWDVPVLAATMTLAVEDAGSGE